MTVNLVKDVRRDIRLNKDLRHENIQIKNELRLLERKIAQLKEYEIENQRLRTLLDLKEDVSYETLPARVIGRDITGASQLIIIDKGVKSGIKEDMPVVSGQGVVGKVIEAGLLSSKVQLLIDKRNRIGGIMQKSRIVGLVEGTGRGFLIINFLPRDEDIYVNDLVLTSGLGGVYEKGLVIGTVKSVYEAKFALYKYAEVIPAVSFNKLEEVLVILKPKHDTL
jgi:rod shape-determining protein MreC